MQKSRTRQRAAKSAAHLVMRTMGEVARLRTTVGEVGGATARWLLRGAFAVNANVRMFFSEGVVDLVTMRTWDSAMWRSS